MRKIAADHTARRGTRRKWQGRFWAGVVSVFIFVVLISMAATGLSFVGYENRVDESAQQTVTEPGKGQIVQVGSGSCSKVDFDNFSGGLSHRQYIPCPEGRDINRDYQLPTNRMEKFSKGFAR
jgi:hypothetical protein